ncbi:MAG: 4-hydroxy-tetrahydrodipicolinate synthase [Chloroflexi bacterium]|nr:4-hydroxy-tetrahydrodipicolinate synthase [Chloroflexota bacterium]
MAELGRLFTAMVTPFDQQGAVDYTQAGRLARALVESGSDGVVVAGTTGESPTLTHSEKARLFAEVRQALGGRGSVVAGAGTYSTQESIELTREAQKAGADAVLLVVPYYNKPTQEGLERHFRAIAESTSLPCILYNVPSRTITNLAAETTLRLSQVPNIVGIKEASADFDQIAKIVSGARAGFRVWSGNDSDTFALMCLGGYGVVSVASHLVGGQIKRMMEMVLVGKLEEAAREHRRLLPLFKGMFVLSNPIPVKYSVNIVGFNVGGLRLPLTMPDERTASQLKELLAGYRVDLPVPAGR